MSAAGGRGPSGVFVCAPRGRTAIASASGDKRAIPRPQGANGPRSHLQLQSQLRRGTLLVPIFELDTGMLKVLRVPGHDHHTIPKCMCSDKDIGVMVGGAHCSEGGPKMASSIPDGKVEILPRHRLNQALECSELDPSVLEHEFTPDFVVNNGTDDKQRIPTDFIPEPSDDPLVCGMLFEKLGDDVGVERVAAHPVRGNRRVTGLRMRSASNSLHQFSPRSSGVASQESSQRSSILFWGRKALPARAGLPDAILALRFRIPTVLATIFPLLGLYLV